ncbi:MAG: hypothetical protein Q8L37_02400 [Candidatus Gottesmanbacteria bacterium]|nr:hypothetical protein [Candidatus Gottesmanbacteria bacterium]
MDDQPAGVSSQPQNSNVAQPSSLTYEETPVIESVPQEPPQEIPFPSELPKPIHHSFGSTIGMMILFLLLFAVGMGISVFLRQYLGSRSERSTVAETIQPTPTSSPTPYVINLLSPTATPTATIAPRSDAWISYPVVSGTTKQPIVGVTFQLPPDVLPPICDGGNCASQGTYLPGGSRFTVAPRGRGQLLVDARGNVGLTDASGKSFVIKQVVLTNGKKALEYTGNFGGSTVGGYTFSSMHGFMIEIDDGMTLEMNNFAPAGLTVDFVGDEAVFTKIVATVEKNLQSLTTLTPTPTRVVTPTGTLQPTP